MNNLNVESVALLFSASRNAASKAKTMLKYKKKGALSVSSLTPLDLSKISGYVENQPSDTIISKVFLKAKEKSEFIALQSSPAEKRKKMRAAS